MISLLLVVLQLVIMNSLSECGVLTPDDSLKTYLIDQKIHPINMKGLNGSISTVSLLQIVQLNRLASSSLKSAVVRRSLY